MAGGVGTAVGGGTSMAITVATGGIGAGAGKAVGGTIGTALTKIDQNQEHKKAKKLEKFFEGFEDRFGDWTSFLVDIFMDIFISYNIQFCHLLSDLIDSWTKAMTKMAEDSVDRIFEQLSKEDDTDIEVTKAMIIDCFLKGRSEKKYTKIVKGKLYAGGEIKTKNHGTLLTSELLGKPLRWDLYDSKKGETCKYMYRHPFEHELIENYASNYNSVDQFQALIELKLKIKPSIEKELLNSKQIRDVMDAIDKNSEAIKDFCNELAKKNEEARQQGSAQLMTKEQAKELFLSEVGYEKIDHFEFDVSNVSQKPRNVHCIDLESSTLVTGFDLKSSAKVNATTIHKQSQVKEATSSMAIIDQTHSFSVKKLLLKEDRDDPLIKMLIKIGRAKMNPVTQEQIIADLYSEGYPPEIEVGPFGAGFTMVASTTCSVDTNTEHSELVNKASTVNRIYFQDKLKSFQGSLSQDQSLDEDLCESEGGFQKYKFKCNFVRKGNQLSALSLFPEVDSQLDLKHTKKIRLYKIVRDSAEKFGEELQIEEFLDEAARALENVYKDGYKYSIGEISVDPMTMEKNVLLIGKTGVGKSLLGNVLTGRHGFKVSDSTKSCTKDAQLMRNQDRKIALIDTKGLCDTEKIIEMSTAKPTEMAKIIAEEIEAFWKAIAQISVNCILLVTDGSRFALEEVKMVEFVCQNLFEDSLNDRVLLVITKRDQMHLENERSRLLWLEENSSGDTPFAHYYSLIKKDPNRAIFVNNINTLAYSKPEDKRKFAINNMEMAKKVITAVHEKMNFPAVSIRAAVRNAIQNSEKLDEQIRKETDDRRKKELEAQKKSNDDTVKKESIKTAEKAMSCLLGSCKILMADYSTKPIKDIKAGDTIMDGNLNPTTVLAANSSFLGSRNLYQFNQQGPVFTPEHQFYIDLSLGQVAVVSRPALFNENPQLEERPVFEMHQCSTMLHFNGNQVLKVPFELNRYHEKLDPSTIVYFIITSRSDGSYIVDNFVSRHELPDFQAWPMTYGTLGLVLASCQLDFFVDTIANDSILAATIQDLVKLWKLTLFYYKNYLPETHFDQDEIGSSDINNVLAHSTEMLADIVNNQCKMRVAQYLNMFGAKILHDFLDNGKIAIQKRLTCMRTIVTVTQNYFE